MNYNENFSELLILKIMMKNKNFLLNISHSFEDKYFNNINISKIFNFLKDYIEKYKVIPPFDVLMSSFNEDKQQILSIIEEAKSIDFDEITNWDYLIDSTNNYLKNQAIKNAIVDSVDIIDNNGDLNVIRKKIENALTKDLKINLGLLYFKEINERLKRIYENTLFKVPTGFYSFDEYINGGFPPYSLSVFIAKIHAGKSNLMANMASRQVLKGNNVAILTLEMSQDAFAQRFDSIFSLMDINRIYEKSNFKFFKESWLKNILKQKKKVQENYKNKRIEEERKKGNEDWINDLLKSNDKIFILSELVKKDEKLREHEKLNIKKGRGEIFIKQFPTGNANINDFKSYIRELNFRGIKLDIVYVDYINLMKPTMSEYNNNIYSSVKKIAEELRSLSFEFMIPIISVSQLNREGSFADFENLNFNYIAESMGLPATADFVCMLGTNEDKMVYENEIWYKIIKNRFGRPGVIDKFYIDARSLKMYDNTEENVWLEDAKTSKDERNLYEGEENE